MSTRTKRSGRSFNHTADKCPKTTMLTLGFTEEQAKRMMGVRRLLPYVEDRKAPCIDARKLWEKIGKPHGQFNKWIERGVAELLDEFAQNSEVAIRHVSTKGRPRTDYTLSRDCAVHLAMMARTPEGKEVRSYFLDMEELSIKLLAHNPLRCSELAAIDNRVTHLTTIRAGEKAKSGELPRAWVRQEAIETERRLKGLVCKILTGLKPSEWKAKVGKPIRDSLITEDLSQYNRAYESASAMYAGGMTLGAIEQTLMIPYGNAIVVDEYLQKLNETEVA